jgi:branched-chain amino acid transport system ATP-binding protein
MSAPAKPSGQPALILSGVAGGYGRTGVIRDLSLTVESASVTALLGPNGAGKTTLLNIVSGLLHATSGSIRLGGKDVTRASANRRVAEGLCHIPQGRGIFRSLTVRENLVMQSVPRREADAIEKALTIFPMLKKRLGQTAGVLSGGEQQMLALSRAYVREPRVILVDEPSFGLAPIIVEAVFEYLQMISKQGVALLLVDQFVARALEMAQSVYVLGKGEVVFTGTSADLQQSDLLEQYLGTKLWAPARRLGRPLDKPGNWLPSPTAAKRGGASRDQWIVTQESGLAAAGPWPASRTGDGYMFMR